MARIATREPRLREIELADGRLVSVSEQPMADGGWIVTLCDMTDRRRLKRIIERTERFMVSVIEAIPEAILVKDARTLRYVLVNRAAERLLGLPRSAIMGKTARLLFPAAAADLVAAQDEMLVKGNPEIGTGVTTLETPNHGRRLVTIRRIPVGKPGEIPRLLVSLIEDHTLLVDEATAMPGPPV